MLEIKNIHGQVLDLPSEQKLTVELMATLMSDDDVLEGSRSYPLRVPLTESVKQFIRHGQLTYSALVEDIPVTVSSGGYTLHKCTFVYQVKGRELMAALKIDLGEAVSKIRNVNLSEVVRDGVYLGNTPQQINATLTRLAQAVPCENPVVFFPVKNPSFFGTQTFDVPTGLTLQPLQNTYMNNYLTGGDGSLAWVFDETWTLLVVTPTYPVGYPLVPFPYLCFVVKRVCEYLGYTPEGDWYHDDEIRRLVIYNTRALETNYNTATRKFTTNGQVYLYRHLPEMTVSDFLKAVRSMGVGIYFDARTKRVRFRKVRELLHDVAYTDLSKYVEPDPDHTFPDDRGYTIEMLKDSTDKLYDTRTNYVKARVIGNGSRKQTLKVGTLFATTDYLRGWVVAEASQVGNIAGNVYEKSEASTPERTLKNRYALRLLSYRGMQPTALGPLYPYGTSVDYRYPNIYDFGFCLDPSRPTSLWQQQQRLYFELLCSHRRTKARALLPLSVLDALRLGNKVAARFDGALTKFILDKISYEIPAREGKVVALLEMVKALPLSISPYRDTTGTSTIWAWIEYRDVRLNTTGTVTTQLADVWVTFWNQPEKITPLNVTDLLISFLRRDNNNGVITETAFTFICDGDEVKLVDDAPLELTDTNIEEPQSLLLEYALIEDPNYNIIP